MERIETVDDPRVAAYRNLPERTLCGESVFVAEGRLLVLRLLASRYQTRSVLVSQQHAEEFQGLVGGRVPLYVAQSPVLRAIVGFAFHRGVLAAGRRPRPRPLEDLMAALAGRETLSLFVCPEIKQPENLGLIFRTAAGFGLDGVVLGQGCCDPFSRRSLRLSMGGVLRVPMASSGDLPADLDRLKRRWDVQLTAAVLQDDAERLPEVGWPARAAVLLGNEFEGLREDWLARCGRRVTVPMAPGTDSLNVGVAAGIFAYAMKCSER